MNLSHKVSHLVKDSNIYSSNERKERENELKRGERGTGAFGSDQSLKRVWIKFKVRKFIRSSFEVEQ